VIEGTTFTFLLVFREGTGGGCLGGRSAGSFMVVGVAFGVIDITGLVRILDLCLTLGERCEEFLSLLFADRAAFDCFPERL
jgi:hypothetical protein